MDRNTDQWVLDFLVTQGHEQAVIRFCEETGLSVPEAIQTLPLRNAVRQHILKGNVSQALDFLSEQKPEVRVMPQWPQTKGRKSFMHHAELSDAETKNLITIFRLIVLAASLDVVRVVADE